MGLFLASSALPGQTHAPVPEPDSNAAFAPKRIHLILKDGSYQVVTSYTVAGKIVRYISAERGGAQEEIPLELVDLDATHRWEKQHSAPAEGEGAPPPALDPELLKEEEARAALTPAVEPDLLLSPEDTLLALDFYQGTPELVPLVQSDGDLNHTTSHNVVRKIVNPRSASHQLVILRGVKSYVQLHVDTPDFYLRVGDDAQVPTGGTPLVVDTHGASSIDSGGSSVNSRYVVVRADVRTDARLIASFSTSLLGTPRQNEDVVETRAETLRGGHWIKLTPARPLEIGEYALVEVLSGKELNLSVWDFGVHPTAPDNRDAVKPEPKRRPNLERRKPE